MNETYEQQMKDSNMIFTQISTSAIDNFQDANSLLMTIYIPDMTISRAGISHALKRLEKHYNTKGQEENDTLEEKFRSFLDGLEMMHIDEFLKESPTKLKMIGIDMSIRVRKLQKYKKAFEAAKAFIDSHVADPDITDEMMDKYSKYLASLEELNI